MAVKPSEPLHRIEYDGETMRIVIPYRVAWLGIPFQLIWLFVWFMGGLSWRNSMPSSFGVVLMIPWILGLAVGLYSLVRSLSGGEILELTATSLTRYYKVLGFAYPRQYLAEHIKDLRLASKRREIKKDELTWLTAQGASEANVLAFDYGSKTIRVASGIEEAEGKMILAAIRQRFPQLLEVTASDSRSPSAAYR